MKMTRSRKNSGEVVERSLASFAAALEHAFYAEKLAKQNGLLQKIDPRVKIVAILPLIVIAALARLVGYRCAFRTAIAIALLSKVPLSTLAKRVWLGVLAITGVISVPALFLTPGRAIYNAPLPGWTVTAQGLRAATYLIMRAETAATFSVLLVLCTPWSNLLKALRVLRLPPEARKTNQAIVDLLGKLAEQKKATPAQVALAWLLAQKPWIVPIPGTTKLARFEENIGAVGVELTPEDLRQIDSAASKITVQGARYPEALQKMVGR